MSEAECIEMLKLIAVISPDWNQRALESGRLLVRYLEENGHGPVAEALRRAVFS